MAKRVKKVKAPKINKKLIEKNLDDMWSKAVKVRDNNKCVRCGGNYGMQSHHIFSRRHKATRWDIDNGVALCTGCHIFYAHRDVGGFCSWYMDKFGKEQFFRLDQLSKVTFKPDADYYDRVGAQLRGYL